MSDKLKVGVVGVGSFGKNHARVYSELGKAGEVEYLGAADANAANSAAIAAEHGGRAFSSPAELIAAGVQAASVAVPTKFHLAVARELLSAGVDVLIEKPLAISLDEADELAELAAKHGRIVQVGHLERFNPAVRATLPVITHPMFFEAHRLSIFTPRSLDVDVVMDLMIHDLDIVLSMAGSPVREVVASGLPVLTHKVDIASVRVEFENGCIANFTASRVSTERVRKLRFFQPGQYVSLDFSRRDVFALTVRPTEGGLPEIRQYKPEVADVEPLRNELTSFLHAVRTRSTPVVTLADGRAALALALEIGRKMLEHNQRAHLAEVIANHPPKVF